MAKSKFEQLKHFFENELWDITRVQDAVRNGWITEEQFAEIAGAEQLAQFESEEAHRDLTATEVFAIFAKAQANAIEIDDQTSLRMMKYYPTFEESIGQTVTQGFKFTHNGDMYKTIQPSLTMQEQYAPGTGTESLYARIDVAHVGNKYDPIPYSGNMALENGKYYTQDGVLYLCNRDTGNPVYNTLAELVGLYVTEV